MTAFLTSGRFRVITSTFSRRSLSTAGWSFVGARWSSSGLPDRRTGAVSPKKRCLSSRMRAIQITELSGPRSALAEVELPEPGPSHMLTPGEGVVVDVHSAGVSFPEVLQTRGEYQLKPPLPVRPRQRGRRDRARGPDRSLGRRGRPGRRLLHARRFRRGRGRSDLLHLHAPRRFQLRRGRGADPQLPHRLLLPEDPRPARRGRDRPRPRRRRRRRRRRDPGRAEGLGAIDDRGRLERRQGARRPRGRRRPRRPLRRRMAGSGEGALGRRRRPRPRPGRRRSLHRQPALARRGRQAGRRRLHRRARSRRSRSTGCCSTTPR